MRLWSKLMTCGWLLPRDTTSSVTLPLSRQASSFFFILFHEFLFPRHRSCRLLTRSENGNAGEGEEARAARSRRGRWQQAALPRQPVRKNLSSFSPLFCFCLFALILSVHRVWFEKIVTACSQFLMKCLSLACVPMSRAIGCDRPSPRATLPIDAFKNQGEWNILPADIIHTYHHLVLVPFSRTDMKSLIFDEWNRPTKTLFFWWIAILLISLSKHMEQLIRRSELELEVMEDYLRCKWLI